MSKIVHKDMDDRISNLKTQLIIEHPFFGVFLSNTDMLQEDNIPTAATDGIRIYYNEKFFDQLKDEELKGVLMHEVFHMVYSHCSKKRRGIRYPKKWNVAADYAINWEIDEMDHKSIRLPNNIIINGKEFKVYLDKKYRNKYVEQIYDELPDSAGNEDGMDIHMDMPDDEEKQQEIEDRILAAYETSKREEGKLPNGIIRAVEEIKKARVPWTRIFQRYLGSALAREDYSYSMPNRRFIGQDLYMPSLLSYKLGLVAVAIDTSGSIGQNELGAFANELRKVSALISEVIVMSCDAAVHSFEVIRDTTNFINAVKKLKGGGGTDFRPPFDELKKRQITPEVFIYLTDGEGSFPNKHQVPYPTIWVMTTEKKAPFGMTVQMRL